MDAGIFCQEAQEEGEEETQVSSQVYMVTFEPNMTVKDMRAALSKVQHNVNVYREEMERWQVIEGELKRMLAESGKT